MRTAPITDKAKAHINKRMRRLFEKAMLWGFVPPAHNPMDLVELRGMTRSRRSR
jgi:hypothetical protein